MTYWIPTTVGRVSASTLKDAYRDAAAELIALYKATKGQIHKAIPGYHGSEGIKIYNSATGKSGNHWVRFSNGSNPKDGYEEVVYDKRFGIAYKVKSFPKNWL